MERLLTESWKVPLSNYVVMNEDQLITVIDQMRSSIPRQVRQAEQIQQNQEQLIAEAQEDAQGILEAARVKAAELTEQHEIIKAAKQREELILERARVEAEKLRTDAEDYAKEVLLGMERHLGALSNELDSLQTTVRNGLRALARPQEPTSDE